MRTGSTLYYLLSDHLNSTSITLNASGQVVSELRYKAFGETRYTNGNTPTDYRYTGQRQQREIGLYYYNARFYDPALGRFTSPDTIVPGAGNVKAFDRYAYGLNNPIKYNDPSGHCSVSGHWMDDSSSACQWSSSQNGDSNGNDNGSDNPLTDKGNKMYELYGRWQKVHGNMSPQQFFGWMMYYEMSGTQGNTVPYNGLTVLDMMEEIIARQLWGDSPAHAPYCISANCVNGLFNFLGRYASVAIDRADDDPLAEIDYPQGGYQIKNSDGSFSFFQDKLLTDAGTFTNAVLNPKPEWKVYNNQLPYHWGNPDWADDFQGPVNTTDTRGVIYKNGSFMFYTENQASCQERGIC